ncbi:MAG: cytochrome d ubiquinol oxidase subunit II [Ignavibacteriaceae bacterium]|nr:cytochrome d ubiquinol oxidase subunit II [Ignavibacteriaceae bacterium]
MDLNIIWFLLVGILIIGYAVLDGFDLGVGIIHLFTKDENEKRINLNAIGPVWDGNEVWLLTGGGALFAAFPIVYATVFSGFYLAFMLLLAALIFRAVSFEFRKYSEPKDKKYWDLAFGIGSLVPALLYGVAIGNILRGLPIDVKGAYHGSFLGLLNPYALAVGAVSLVMFVMHGAIYMTLKTDGLLRDKMIRRANTSWIVFVLLYFIATFMTIFSGRWLFESVLGFPIFWILLALLFITIIYIPIGLKTKRFGNTFTASTLIITSMILLVALSLFPKLVPSSLDLGYSLTIYNASSTPRTLETMLIIAIIGVPIVLVYTIWIYRIFRGKVELNKDSY